MTKNEAEELLSDLDDLLNNKKINHAHVSSSDYKKEITIALYDDKSLNDFDERTKKLIIEDK